MKKRCMKILLLFTFAAFPQGSSDAQQTTRKGTTKARVGAPRDSALQRNIRTPAKRQRFWLENQMLNVYDSNVEHDSTNIGSHGFVVGANARFRTRSSRPSLLLEYGIARHSYTATDRWDRVSQLGRLGLDFPAGALLFGVVGEASLKGSSEDREIGDQYAVLPRIELRPLDDLRLRVIGAYRQRYYGEASGSNAVNRYVNVDMRWRVTPGTFEAGARFEENRPERSRNRFQRFTYSSAFTWLLGDRDELLVGLEYRPVRYPERTVDIPIIDEDGEEDEIEVPRRDERWKPEVGWLREWNRKIYSELEYEYEARSSNDPDKRYRGHVITFTTGVRW